MDSTNGLRERKKDKLRRTLFVNALRLFAERGFASTSVDDIAATADVSRKTFFRYFATKQDVVVIDEEHKIEIVDRALRERRNDETVPAAVGRALGELARYYASEPDVVRALYRLGSTEPVIGHRLLEHHAVWQQSVARSVAAALGTDPTRDIRPHVIAAAALASARLALSEWVANDCAGAPGKAIARHFEAARPALELLALPAGMGTIDARQPAAPR